MLDDAARGLDHVLHDLAGQILGVPVWQMLGGKGPRRTPIYSSSIHFEGLVPLEQPAGLPGVLAACQQDHEAGYRDFKVKIGRGLRWMPPSEGLTRDVAATRAVREANPEARILVDANNAYSVDDCIQYLDGVADCDLFWIEEPFREDWSQLILPKEHMYKSGCGALIVEGEDRFEAPDPPGPYGATRRRT